MTEIVKLTLKWGTAVLVLIIMVTASVGVGMRLGARHSVAPRVRSLAPTITQLERIGELATTRVHVADILLAEGEGYRGSWLIKGDALLSCDMSQARIANVNPEARTATIHLPSPRVVSARVDHDKTKVWSVEKTTWLPWKWGDQSLLQDAAMAHAQQLIESTADQKRNLEQSQSQTELLIRQMYDLVEWKVNVEWEK